MRTDGKQRETSALITASLGKLLSGLLCSQRQREGHLTPREEAKGLPAPTGIRYDGAQAVIMFTPSLLRTLRPEAGTCSLVQVRPELSLPIGAEGLDEDSQPYPAPSGGWDSLGSL